MVFGSLITSPRGTLSLQQELRLANVYLENAYNEDDEDIALVLCHDTEVSLSQARKAVKRTEDQNVIEEIATAYMNLGNLLESQHRPREAQAIYMKAEKLGVSHRAEQIFPVKLRQRKFRIPKHIFAEITTPPSIVTGLPEIEGKLSSTPQLACCLNFLRTSFSLDDILDPSVSRWIQAVEEDDDEQERLKMLSLEVVRAYKSEEPKDAKVVDEVVYLAPVLEKTVFRDLLNEFYEGVDRSASMDLHLFDGLAQLVQGANTGYLDADDLVKIMGLLGTCFRDTHQRSQPQTHIYQLTLTFSHVLDAMADTRVSGLDRKNFQDTLLPYLDYLKERSDPHLMYQAAYAYQALQCITEDETFWQAALRRTGKAIQGVSGLVSTVQGLDINSFISGLNDIQQGTAEVRKAIKGLSQLGNKGLDMDRISGLKAMKLRMSEAQSTVKAIPQATVKAIPQSTVKAIQGKGVNALVDSGQGFTEGLKEEFNSRSKAAWYPALRGADVLIGEGEFTSFRKLVCEAPCRQDPAFLWGICQRLGEIAANPLWDTHTRRDAVAFLGEMYRDDEGSGRYVEVKEWILSILMQLSLSESPVQLAETLLQEIESRATTPEQHVLIQTCREKNATPYPLRAVKPSLASPSLLDRVQSKPDVESTLRKLRKQRLSEPEKVVYIQPQAKLDLKASDFHQFALTEKVEDFLSSNQKVFLLLGDSGAGKSTFGQQLEYNLWSRYKRNSGKIPLFINLPTINEPEKDMIGKQLRKAKLTEQEIRELKMHRRFVLICDGYDDSQQIHNLYTSNQLNQPGEWNAQMVISCRSEYLGASYRDRFHPGDRNQGSEAEQFQEAVIMPFTSDQVQEYIKKYVSAHLPQWEAEKYVQALDLIPSLKELVRNPFLMTLTLEVLPRMLNPGERLSATRVTRVALYDQFMEHWFERGRKRLSEKDLGPLAKEAFEALVDGEFTRNGVEFLKRLSTAIYKEQDGQPIIEYSRFKDEGSWKSEFFGREEDKQLLREACPLTRRGNQYRFINRSFMEYGLSLAVFDPQDPNIQHRDEHPDTPLFWRSFVNDTSILHFLEERARQEPLFRRQLLDFIEHSKTDKKWCTAAANAITILVRAGVQFNGADLQGIRIPGADLSYGVFDSAQLQESDLENANLCGTWLRQADLTKTRMSGVRFGELPSLKYDTTVLSCAYSPDGQSFIASLEHGDINVYSTSIWEKIRTLKGHEKPVKRAVCSPQCYQIASASMDMTVKLWDVESGTCQHTLIGHTDGVNCAAFSPRGNQVASASDDMTVRLWDVATGNCRQTLSGHNAAVSCVVYSPQGDQLASGSADYTVLLWDVDSGDRSHTLSGHTDTVLDIAYSPRGDQIASASRDQTARIWDVETGACLRILAGRSGGVYSVVYSPDSIQVASGHDDGTVRLWDTETGICHRALTGHRAAVFSVVYSPKGDMIASGSGDRTTRLWDISVGTLRPESNRHAEDVLCIKYSPDASEIISRSSDNAIRLCDMETRTLRHEFRGHCGKVIGTAYSPQGEQMVSGSADMTVRVWDMQLRECQRILIGHSNGVNCVAYSPQGNQIASASDDRTVRLWDLVTGDCRQTLSGHSEGVLSVVYSADGNQIASCSADNTIRLWDTDTGVCSQILRGHSDQVRNVVYSPQGNQLASASDDGTVQLWDVGTGEYRKVLTLNDSKVTRVRYSPDGDMIASGSLDRMIRLWSVASGQCLTVVQNFQDSILDIAWNATPEGVYMTTGCRDGSLQIWQTIREGDQCHVRLRWGFMRGFPLTLMKAAVQDIHGLSDLNKRLLEQHGAEGVLVSLAR